MRAEIISVGTELLLGDIVNTNARFLAQELAGLGYTVYYQTVVGDNPLRLRSVVLEAKNRSDVLVLTGGLGPTDDDLTKETVAEAFGDVLVMDEDELVQLEQFFQSLGREMAENNRKQAMVPRRGKKLPNENGTAPGVVFRQGDKYAFLLPGPPIEMEPMFTKYVRPALEQMQDAVIRSLVLRVFGMGESDLETKVHDLLLSSNPTAALYAKTGEVHIRITARAETAEKADLMCDQHADLLRKALGNIIYSDKEENLETVVVKTLLENKETLATAESCTGGLLGERITSVPGASGIYGFGAITYSNEAKHAMLGVSNVTLKRFGAVSSQVAAEMAFGAAQKGEANYGVGITGIAGPDGGTPQKPVGLVYVAVAAGSRVYVKKLQLSHRNRAYVRQISSSHALDMVRRLATGLPVNGAKRFGKSQQADFDRIGKPKRRGDALRRMLLALLLIALLVGAVVGGLFLTGRLDAQQKPGTIAALNGLVYGTPEYEMAARDIVTEQNQLNPAVTGLLAVAGEPYERLVTQTPGGQSELLQAEAEPGLEEMAAVAKNAPLAAAKGHVVLAGDKALEPLFAYREEAKAKELTTFSYFTATDTYQYKVFAVLLWNETQEQPDGFDPMALQLHDYESFTTFYLGAKARSLYEIPVVVKEGDRFMTMVVPTGSAEEKLLLCGRLVRPGETTDTAKLAQAGSPFMPAGYYEDSEQQHAAFEKIYAAWLSWYLSRDADASALQLEAGIPARDSEPDTVDADSESTSTSKPEAESGKDKSFTFPDAGQLTVTMNGKVVTGKPEVILAQICQREMAGAEKAAIQAQAVAAHSWIRNQHMAGNRAPLVLGAPPSVEVQKAVAEVADIVLSSDEKAPAFTSYFSLAAYGTNPAENLWGIVRPYLAEVKSPHDENLNSWRSIVSVTKEEFAEMVEQNLGKTLRENDAGQWIGELEKTETGYVTYIELAGERVKGVDLWRRILVRDGKALLLSPAYDVEFDGEAFTFVVYGQGHGCGMSQTGAAAYAREGWSYEAILSHYYPETNIIHWK